MPRRTVANLLALAVLSYLSSRPMHPYELGRTLKENGDARSIKFSHGSLYMVVGQLERAGFVTAQNTAQEGRRPERTVYAITGAGRAEMHDWLRELVADPTYEYPRFTAALSLIAALPPQDAADLLRTRLTGLAAQRADAQEVVDTAVAQGVPALFLVEEEYRISLLDAETAFVRRFIDRIIDPENGWGAEWAAHHQAPPPH